MGGFACLLALRKLYFSFDVDGLRHSTSVTLPPLNVIFMSLYMKIFLGPTSSMFLGCPNIAVTSSVLLPSGSNSAGGAEDAALWSGDPAWEAWPSTSCSALSASCDCWAIS